MITLPELLEDKVYREFFTTRPVMPTMHPTLRPWRLYVRKHADSPWGRRDFDTYVSAFRYLKPMLTTIYDGTIQSKGIAFGPPVRVVRVMSKGKPKLDEKGQQVYRRIVWLPKLDPLGDERHEWCTYCRRPTVFTWFSKHHAFPKGTIFDPAMQRCTICGASERLVLNRG